MTNRLTLANGLKVKVYDDSNYKELIDHAHKNGFGLTTEIRDYTMTPRGSIPGVPASTVKKIPRSDWSAAIKELQDRKALLSDYWIRGKCKILNQGQTNYCWVNGVVSAIYAIRALNGLPFVELSPASVAAIIKNFRNVGGWGTEAIKYIALHGITRAALWPCNAIDRKYNTAEAKADALKHRISEWTDLGRDFDLQRTYLLLQKPIAKGYNWWRHETCGLDPVEIEPGSFGHLDVNSWGPTWDEDGMVVLREGKATGDDAVSPEVVDVTTIAA